MRRYGTFQYGETQYGEGALDAYMQSVAIFDSDFEVTSKRIVKTTDNITFTDALLSDVLRQAWMQDQINFSLDLRLKYVRVDYSTTITFSMTTNMNAIEDQFAFSNDLRIAVIKHVFLADHITFDSELHARRNWEPVINPYEDEIWTPALATSSTWTPRVNTADLWTPREQNNG
jgi:hypothetical protein